MLIASPFLFNMWIVAIKLANYIWTAYYVYTTPRFWGSNPPLEGKQKNPP